jgi:hypothetical protein
MAASLQAYHSLAGVYDMKQEAELPGSVESIEFTNPHGSLPLAVENQGWLDGYLGDDTWFRHGPRAEGDRETPVARCTS